MIKIWVDDERPVPEGYAIHARSVYDAIWFLGQNYLKFNGEQLLLDLDHDAGEYTRFGGDYINILKWLEDWWENEKDSILGCYEWDDDRPKAYEKIKVKFHSANPVGIENMRRIVKSCSLFEEI